METPFYVLRKTGSRTCFLGTDSQPVLNSTHIQRYSTADEAASDANRVLQERGTVYEVVSQTALED